MASRHVVTGVTLAVLCGILAVGGVLGWQALTEPLSDDETPSSSSTCARTEVRRGERVRTRDVTVSVFNAGSRVGLADQTRRRLVRRGFVEGEVGNAPSETRVRVVQVWTTRRKDVAARLVALQFGRDTPIRVVDDNLGPGVVVVVGNDFDGLARRAPRSIRATADQATCLEG